MRKDGGQAFPVADQGLHGSYGMTLRDWFAGQALAGLLADPDIILNEHDVAATVYRYADAMLAARVASNG